MKSTPRRPHQIVTLIIGFLLGCQLSDLIRYHLSSPAYPIAPEHVLEVASSRNSRNSSGWHQVDVFYGESSYLDSHPPRDNQWTSQADQDRIVWLLLNKTIGGYFVDLAANDATFWSNTYALETVYNWTGLCLEANPKYWHRLAARPRCKVVGAVVGHRTMEAVNFTFNPMGKQFSPTDAAVLGGILKYGFDNGEEGGKHSIVEPRYTVSLSDVFDRYNVPSIIDYLSLDVEGAESYIMSSFPLENYTIKVLTVERPKEDLWKRLRMMGYAYIKDLSNFGETIFYHTSFRSSLDFKSAGLEKKKRKKKKKNDQ